MKAKLLVLAAGLLLLGSGAPARHAQAAVSVGVSVVTGGPHRGLSLSFSSRPRFGLSPGSQVYYGSDIDRDVYSYGDEWYYVDQDSWYRGPSYEGPFVAINFASVPYEVRGVPVRYRRHWSDSWSSNRSTYGNYGGGYSNGGGYGRDNRGGYSDQNNQNNQRNRSSWNNQNNQNNQRNRGSWSDRGGSQGRGRGNNKGQGGNNGQGNNNGQGGNDNRGQGQGNWNR